jgi:hypothetical protein
MMNWEGWVGHVAQMEEPRNAYKILVGKPQLKRRDHMGDLCINGRMLLKLIFEISFGSGEASSGGPL